MNNAKACPGTAASSPDALWQKDQAGSYQWPSKVYVPSSLISIVIYLYKRVKNNRKDILLDRDL